MFADFVRYLDFFHGKRRLIWIACAAAILQAGLQLAIPLTVKHIFDVSLPQHSFLPLAAAGGTLLLLYLLQAGVIVFSRLAILRAVKQTTAKLRGILNERLNSLSMSHLQHSDRGHLHNTVVTDTERVDAIGNLVAAEIFPALLISVVLCGLLITIHCGLFLILLIMLGPVVLATHGFAKPVLRKRINRFHRSFEKFSRSVYRALELMDLTRMLAAEKVEADRLANEIDQLHESSFSTAKFSIGLNAIQQTVIPACAIVTLIAGGVFVANSQLSTSELITFYITVVMLRNSVTTILLRYPKCIEANSSLRNIFQILDHGQVNEYSGQQVVTDPEIISVESVRFGYGQNLPLRNVNLELRRGEIIAITGANGSGKSTLLKLLIGLYRPSDGRILVDNVCYDDVDMATLRRSVGVVQQHPQFFEGTIRENLVHGCPPLKDEEIVTASKLATADDFVSELPNRYETLIGEDGMRLSGGQKQRLAIARALLHSPNFLFLDEPTNHLEQCTLTTVLGNLKHAGLMPSITIFGHDATIFPHADQIYRLENGELQTCVSAAIAGDNLAIPETRTGAS